MGTHNLQRLFDPKSIAVIGASNRKGSVGYILLHNLIGTEYEGVVYPVNLSAHRCRASRPTPRSARSLRSTSRSLPCRPSRCPDDARVRRGGGRRRRDRERRLPGDRRAGKQLEEEVSAIAKAYGVRILGPNCLGFIRPSRHLNVTFAHVFPPAGRIAFLSQSGALGTAILDWAAANQVGFSAFVSVGSMADVDFGDLIDYFGADSHTSQHHPLRRVHHRRPQVHERRPPLREDQADHRRQERPHRARRHGGRQPHRRHRRRRHALQRRLPARRRRARRRDRGPLRRQRGAEPRLRPRGPRLGIVTNAGGPGVMACDRLLALGGELAELTPETDEKLKACLPTSGRGNPVDVIGDADAKPYAAATQALMDDPNCDGVLAILTPQAMSDPAATAQALVEVSRTHKLKPLLTSFMGKIKVAEGIAHLPRSPPAHLQHPRGRGARLHVHVPVHAQPGEPLRDAGGHPARLLVRTARPSEPTFIEVAREGRSLLSEPEAKSVLAAYQIPTIKTVVATTAEECVAAAEEIGFPVAIKILSHDITHKSDVGGIVLNVRSAAEAASHFAEITERVRQAAPKATIIGVTVQAMSSGGYEVIIGAKKDPTFGPALMFGMGGTGVELYRDVAVDFPPLNQALARSMIQRTKMSRLLEGYRGKAPVDITAIEQAMVKISYLLVDFPEILEMDVNPLQVRPDGICALDARLVIEPKDVRKIKLPGAHLMISMYPSKYHWEMPLDGEPVPIRAIRPEDVPLWSEMIESLSPITAQYRFFGPAPRGDQVLAGALLPHRLRPRDRPGRHQRGQGQERRSRCSASRASASTRPTPTRASSPSSCATTTSAWASAPSSWRPSSRQPVIATSARSMATSWPPTPAWRASRSNSASPTLPAKSPGSAI